MKLIFVENVFIVDDKEIVLIAKFRFANHFCGLLFNLANLMRQ